MGGLIFLNDLELLICLYLSFLFLAFILRVHVVACNLIVSIWEECMYTSSWENSRMLTQVVF